jgi:formyltetrahydrofolate deformylase
LEVYGDWRIVTLKYHKNLLAIQLDLCNNPLIMSTANILNIACLDRPGIIHAIAGFLLTYGGNIDETAAYNDHETGMFFMRVQFSCATASKKVLQAQLLEFAKQFDMRWELNDQNEAMPTVLFVSKEGHCLNDLLYHWQSGQLQIDIRAVLSNHPDLEPLAAKYNVPFHYFNITPSTKAAVESKQYELIQSKGIELVVLARYMQLLSDDLCTKLAGRVINIHHSFLPSFKGAKPYLQAHTRGVKLCGATAHYATADLDDGPIIEQDVARTDHGMSLDALVTQGHDTECQVLARAVKWHSEHRVLLNGQKTVVFR